MDKIFGLSPHALTLCEDRSVLLSGNMVNSSTPHYKARDIDFYGLLKKESDSASSNMETTHSNHIPSSASTSEPLLYRIPMQKSMDGNTVDEDIERKNFVENAIRYQVNLTFIQNKTEQVLKAIKGE